MSRDRERFSEYHEIVKKVKKDPTFEKTTDHAVMGIRRHVAVPPGTTLNTVTPCAACKLLRRRCAEECPFSPYFSPHEPHKFAAVHKVFGASNVSKMLLEVGESQRGDAANSLVYEANLRLRDPIYGCMAQSPLFSTTFNLSNRNSPQSVQKSSATNTEKPATSLPTKQQQHNFNNTTTSVSDHAALAASILLPPPPPRLLPHDHQGCCLLSQLHRLRPPASLPSPSMVVSSSSSNSSAYQFYI
ncbi:hypothetical protein HID58_018043 [Brassica napus]|uniref:LOB domain-containing protein n=1 Tax=Brassica napus TaxID=3708 RepID=A0ABQ8D8V5_BRANA|nr:hypothetical protein HID58_018043 [Brassica napus]